MKHLSLSLLLVLTLSCGESRKGTNVQTNTSDNIGNSIHRSGSTSRQVVQQPWTPSKPPKPMLFLGHDIDLGIDIGLEFERICSDDDMLDYDSANKNITIYGTTFHVNQWEGHDDFFLLTSVQPDTQQIKIVRDAISKFHGKENYEEPYHYSWLPFRNPDSYDPSYPIIHLRRLHHSEEGGTVVFFY